INCLVPDGADRILIGTDGGVARWDGQRVARVDLPAQFERVPVRAMIRDRDANLWIGTPETLLRLNRRGQVSLDRPGGSGVTALFEDRDSNLWIGTPTGLERWRDGAFTAFPVRSVTKSDAGPIFVDASDRVWFAPSSGGLYWMHDGRIGQVALAGLDKDVI